MHSPYSNQDHGFTDAFFHALKASCKWWLCERPSFSFWDQDQPNVWLNFCKEITKVSPLTSQYVKKCMAKYLEPHQHCDAFFTGYYEPTLYGSLHKTEIFCYPLYKNPQKQNVPHTFSRKDIYDGVLSKQNLELLYVNDMVDPFFLEIQGSGRIVLENGCILRVGYDGQNGQPYTAIGRILVEQGELLKDTVSLFSIKEWLRKYPKKARTVMESNASYVYFKLLEENTLGIDGPIGTQKLPLTPFHSVACDASSWPFGMILVYDIPVGVSKTPLKGYALTQDTGGAIKGDVRFDLFCGAMKEGEHLAGYLKHHGNVTFWLPKKHHE